jgi:hypothetical protein
MPLACTHLARYDFWDKALRAAGRWAPAALSGAEGSAPVEGSLRSRLVLKGYPFRRVRSLRTSQEYLGNQTQRERSEPLNQRCP